MKTIIIGDLEGSKHWKTILNTNKSYDKVVFLGDYFDSKIHSFERQMNNFLDIMELKAKNPYGVITLIGNHDHAYRAKIRDIAMSGYQHENQYAIGSVIDKFCDCGYLQVAYEIDIKTICTHAGISEDFLDYCFGNSYNIYDIADDINELYKLTPTAFSLCGPEPSGDNVLESPIWIRPAALRKSISKFKTAGICQIVGHTPVEKINLKPIDVLFIDSIHTEGSCLIKDHNITYKSIVHKDHSLM